MVKSARNYSSWIVRVQPSTGELRLKVNFNHRFYNDKVFSQDENFVIIFDGVLLNKNELLKSRHVENIEELLKIIYHERNLLANFTGPFTGFVYNKKERQGIAFGNQTGDMSVFYRDMGSELAISNDFNRLTGGINQLDERAAHYLITYGFIVDDSTIIRQIKRVRAGHCLLLANGKYFIGQYHKIHFLDKLDITMDEACEELDKRFRIAVKRCFDKDLEYGYHDHLADLSAGLDSRMTNWVAHDLGYKNIVNLSYSQGGSDEQRFTEQLAKKLNNTLYFRPLDDCSFLYKPEEIVSQEFAMAYYCGITGGYEFLKFIDFEKFGLEHTGQIGDAVIGKFTKLQRNERTINPDLKRNSTLLPLRFLPDTSCYSCEDEFAYYTRMAQGALATHYIRTHYTYTVSPFMDVDVINFCFRLPDALRMNHRLYWYWIDHKYPEAGKLRSSRVRPMGKIKDLLYRGKNKGTRLSIDMLHRFHLVHSSVSANNMNPHNFWFDTKAELRTFVDDYYKENLDRLTDYPQLQKEARQMFNSQMALDKLMGLSLLAAVKQYI